MEKNGCIVLLTGGCRSGKSRLALEQARRLGGPPVFLATAEARDAGMRRRIEAHRRERGPEWRLIEEPVEIAPRIDECRRRGETLVVDCLTLWLSNLLTTGRETGACFEQLRKALAAPGPGHVLLVTNEVGMGIVPENELARRFRDEAGRLAQMVAAVADEVILAVAGLPLRVKG